MGIRWWRWLAPVLVVALGAGVGLAFVAAAIVRPKPLPVDRTPVPLAGHRPCAAVRLWFDGDPEMRDAAGKLRDDPTARRVYTETKAEAYVRFKDLFKDDPELVRLTPPDALPASVTVVPVPGTDLKAYAAELGKRFPDAKKAEDLDTNSVRDKFPPDKRGPVCPRAGEF
ncbi:permease-like cell division protein FtsX [Amycolatopsis rhabdoformis]|uniref:Permease-like cell division protein FtsX n=1 Tax=Amycolatopsis rhabdoformis TaxID=1448059 RepID=A0ABZ1IAG8_9PSEU|nr:permease-like cell division protein FtsX [Amycolatopsis rhabdoformis]WSE30999.1 permease-like cell division protein FtsX [Amycolatopsis rhabdoformis]